MDSGHMKVMINRRNVDSRQVKVMIIRRLLDSVQFVFRDVCSKY